MAAYGTAIEISSRLNISLVTSPIHLPAIVSPIILAIVARTPCVMDDACIFEKWLYLSPSCLDSVCIIRSKLSSIEIIDWPIIKVV